MGAIESAEAVGRFDAVVVEVQLGQAWEADVQQLAQDQIALGRAVIV